MRLAVVIGQVVCTVKHTGFEQDRLLLVEFVDRTGQPIGEQHVAADSIGAGNGEWVLIVGGSSARRTQLNTEVPIDMSVVGIVDEAVVEGQVIYHK